ncbi:MAG TPA: 5'/3'-nucleotidase SurE [Polyangiales bacterium]|nr:5'/3'-nucleotidase SurE [Polyangiales bacterium]
MSDRPILLLTNDDGVHAVGLKVLREALLPLGHVVVVAPTREQSATSHSITIDRPLRHLEHATDVHSIDGTPADCVYLALFEPRFLPRRPDVVVSGVNHGPNVGSAVFYSGTIAGAREGALRGHPGIAFSNSGDMDAPWIARHVHDMVARFLKTPKPTGHAPLINVNFPKGDPRGVRVTRVGRHVYEEAVIPRRDPGGREYFWIGGRVIDYGEVAGSDKQAVDAGFISVTPLALEPTSSDHIALASDVAGPHSAGPDESQEQS